MKRKGRDFITISPAEAVLLMSILSIILTPLSACPESCFCFDKFVTCSDFQYLDLTLLPRGTDTLVLSRGEVEEFPPGFLAMATDLKMLEIISVSARVVRGSAFRGLRNLDLFSITGSSFDIVEPDGFRGLTDVRQFLISDSKFGRVGKHAFADITNVLEFKIWSSEFDAISDEAFYKLTDVLSFQLYQNNITFIGSDVFLGASGVDDVTIYMNRIQTVSEGSFENIASETSRMVLYANKFQCACDIAWMLSKPALREYLSSNECTFPGQTHPSESTFRMADITKDALCPTVPSTEVVESTSAGTIVPSPSTAAPSVSVSGKTATTTNTEQHSSPLTTKVDPHQPSTSPLSPSLSSSSSSSSTRSASQSQSSSSLPSRSTSALSPSSPPSSSHASSSSSSSFSSKSSSQWSSGPTMARTTAPPAEKRVSVTYDGRAASTPTATQTNTSETSDIHVSTTTHSPNHSIKVTNVGKVASVKGSSGDNEHGGHARPYSTSAIGMTTPGPDSSSHVTSASLLLSVALSGVCLLLISTPST